LPLSPQHKALAVSEQDASSASTLNFARHLLALRKKHPALRYGEIEFLDAPPSVLAFRRKHETGDVLCVFNMGAEAVTFDGRQLLAHGHMISPA
jgi:alpha-glucosidase